MGLTDLTLGCDKDATGLVTTPPRRAALERYFEGLGTLTGSVRPRTGKIYGWTFNPAAVVANTGEAGRHPDPGRRAAAALRLPGRHPGARQGPTPEQHATHGDAEVRENAYRAAVRCCHSCRSGRSVPGVRRALEAHPVPMVQDPAAGARSHLRREGLTTEPPASCP
jgi:hypothetical protein